LLRTILRLQQKACNFYLFSWQVAIDADAIASYARIKKQVNQVIANLKTVFKTNALPT